MSGRPPHEREPAEREGAATSRRGTPMPVDVSGDPRAQTAIALFLSGPVIWSTHFMLVYLVVEAGCTGEGPGLRVFAPPVPAVVTVAATAVAAVACLACAAVAYRRWRTDEQRTTDGSVGERKNHAAVLALAGALLALLGFVNVLFVGLPALVLPSC